MKLIDADKLTHDLCVRGKKSIFEVIDEQPTIFGTFQEVVKTANEICRNSNNCNECPFDDDECMIRGMAGCADDIVEICRKYKEEK